MKEFLSHSGHAFTARNVDEDEEAYRELLALGYRSVPITVVGGRAVRGFDEPALREAISAASEP